MHNKENIGNEWNGPHCWCTLMVVDARFLKIKLNYQSYIPKKNMCYRISTVLLPSQKTPICVIRFRWFLDFWSPNIWKDVLTLGLQSPNASDFWARAYGIVAPWPWIFPILTAVAVAPAVRIVASYWRLSDRGTHFFVAFMNDRNPITEKRTH